MYRNSEILKIFLFSFLFLFAFCFLTPETRAENIALENKKTISFLIGSIHSEKMSEALSELNNEESMSSYDFNFFTDKDLENGKIDLNKLQNSQIIFVDQMYRELAEFTIKNINPAKVKIFGLRDTAEYGKKIINNAQVSKYYEFPTVENIKNMIFFVLNRDFSFNIKVEQAKSILEFGIFHPQSKKIFDNFEEYLSWYKSEGLYKKDGFWVGIHDFASYAYPGDNDKALISLVKKLQQNSINVLPVYSTPTSVAMEKFFIDKNGKSRINILVAFSFKFASLNDIKTKELLKKIDVPALNAIRLATKTTEEWRQSEDGLSNFEISSALSVPEFNGLVEATVLGGKSLKKDEKTGEEIYNSELISDNADFFVKRILAWRNLQLKKNKDKKVAIIYYNHGDGKHNVGASYLNVFRSFENLLDKMKKEGYSIKGSVPTEDEVKKMILLSGHNFENWTPEHLEELISSEKIVKIPVNTYLEWYKDLNKNFVAKQKKNWGDVTKSNLMIVNNKIILPCVNLGNVILMPQPVKGWGNDPMKTYHDTNIFPHHQYTAFYLWIKNEFKADAIVHFGTHGTLEWLPGKQTGLSLEDPPEVLIQDLPNIYPYIMDNIGEGTQAKRRGRGVIIDHLIPSMKKAGTYGEYLTLSALINEYNIALNKDKSIADQKFLRIKKLSKELGISKDLNLKDITPDDVENIEHYIIDLNQENIPYGLHSFGVSPQGEELEEFASLIKERNPELDINKIKDDLSRCYFETDNFLKGLNGGYVTSGEGNDPLRNSDAIPTGNNFYGFDPAKVPSREAFIVGENAAKDMLQKYHNKKSVYPDKIGLILWATELQRNEGSQVGTALYLMGMKPVWDSNDKIKGVEVIPAGKLNRPRIDVHLQCSGLFRDSFPNIMLLLDDAVKQAGKLKDSENYIAKNNLKIRNYLVSEGYKNEDADELSKIRVFSEKPGSYNNKVSDLAAQSGFWERDDEISDVYINHSSFGFSKSRWGTPLKKVYEENLKDVDITAHTRSSNLINVLDNDDVYSYLGGLSLAVKKLSGEAPEAVISRQEDSKNIHVENIERTIGEELRTRYLNPKWIEGAKKEKYAGAREMDRFVQYLWGWQVTTPYAVHNSKWEQVYQVYYKDKYNMKIKDFIKQNNPWVRQSMSATMLEAVRKNYWNASEEIKKTLANEYAQSVIEDGISGAINDNPKLNKLVLKYLSKQDAMKLRKIIEKASGKTLEEALKENNKLHDKVLSGLKMQQNKKYQSSNKQVAKIEKQKKELNSDNNKKIQEKTENKIKEQLTEKNENERIDGYELIEQKNKTGKIVDKQNIWLLPIIIAGMMALFLIGWLKKK